MGTFSDAKRDAKDFALLVNEDTDVDTRYGGTKPSYIKKLNQLAYNFNLTPAFDFADGFIIQTRNQAGLGADGNYWIYNGALPFEVTAGTVPSEPDYKKVTFSEAQNVALSSGENLQQASERVNMELDVLSAGLLSVDNELQSTIENSVFGVMQPSSEVYPKAKSLEVGDIIPSGITHLLIGGTVYKQVPTRAGTVNEIIDGQVLVGSVKCNMINEPLLNKSTPAAVIGKRLRDGTATKIACYGDSTMWGATVGDLETQNPNNAPAMLNEALKSIYGGGIVTYVNRAKSGTTLRQLLSGGDGSGSTFAEKLQTGGLDNDANVIYCNHGTNDATQDNDIGQYVLDLETFISLCRAQDITPILVTPNPKTYLPSLVDEPKLKRLQHYVNTMRKVASDYNVDLVDQYELFTASNNQFKPNEIAPDGVHLSNGAYRQSGFNLAIPLVNCHKIGVDSKIAPLNSMSWFDNFSGREFQQQATSPGGFVLKADRASDTGLNLPVLLEQGQDNIFVSGLRWSNGTVMDVALNKVATGQKLNFEANAGSTSYLNYDSRARLEFRMYAGLQILGLTFDMSETGSNNQVAIGGLALSDNSGAGVTKITGTNSRGLRLNYWDQVIIPSFNFIGGGQKLEFVDIGGNDAMQIYINVGQELKIDIIKDSVVESSTIMEAVFVDGNYPVNLSFNYDSISSTVNTSFQSVSYEGMPELYIKTPNIIYDVVSVFP